MKKEGDKIDVFNTLADAISPNPCVGCKTAHGHRRLDYYGIFTGNWCELCYMDSEIYPFRKDRYPTMEHDGYGERLGSDDEENDIPQW